MKEPTVAQCSGREKIFQDETHVAYACWYPQMGGYVGKCVAIFDRMWKKYKTGAACGGCIDVLVWHDGEFPFSETDGDPKELHHCDPSQFVQFGEFLLETNNKNKVDV